MKRPAMVLLVLGLAWPWPALAATDRTLRLPIGDPARKNHEAPVVLDGVTNTATGEVLTLEALPETLAQTRLLLIGETHTAMEFHRVQATVIRALQASGRHVVIGLEMFPDTAQPWLDNWHDGLLTEEGFVRLSHWYQLWSYPWAYYRDIFLFARDTHIPMFALNTPREVVAAVRQKGFADLSPEEAAHMPPRVDVDSDEHMTFFKASLGDEAGTMHGGMSEEAWKNMLNAQATWDATMGYHAVQILKREAFRDAIMVVLVGSGHVAYGLGIERQARLWFDGAIASLIPVPVYDPDEARAIDVVQASYANFVWGVPAERAPQFPSLGLSTRAIQGSSQRQVINVEKDSAAREGGFQVGDVLVSMDGTALDDQEVLSRLMAEKRWGSRAVFTVRRGNEELTLTVLFRRTGTG